MTVEWACRRCWARSVRLCARSSGGDRSSRRSEPWCAPWSSGGGLAAAMSRCPCGRYVDPRSFQEIPWEPPDGLEPVLNSERARGTGWSRPGPDVWSAAERGRPRGVPVPQGGKRRGLSWPGPVGVGRAGDVRAAPPRPRRASTRPMALPRSSVNQTCRPGPVAMLNTAALPPLSHAPRLPSAAWHTRPLRVVSALRQSRAGSRCRLRTRHQDPEETS